MNKEDEKRFVEALMGASLTTNQVKIVLDLLHHAYLLGKTEKTN